MEEICPRKDSPAISLDNKDKKRFFESFNGKEIFHTDKNNIETRLKTYRVPRRMMDSRIVAILSVNGIDFDLPEG